VRLTEVLTVTLRSPFLLTYDAQGVYESVVSSGVSRIHFNMVCAFANILLADNLTGIGN
jgi:hypothetical protein